MTASERASDHPRAGQSAGPWDSAWVSSFAALTFEQMGAMSTGTMWTDGPMVAKTDCRWETTEDGGKGGSVVVSKAGSWADESAETTDAGTAFSKAAPTADARAALMAIGTACSTADERVYVRAAPSVASSAASTVCWRDG